MIKAAKIQFVPWEKIYEFADEALNELKRGDYIIVKTTSGLDLGKILEFEMIEEKRYEANQTENDIKQFIRKANLQDLEKLTQQEKNKEEALKKCKEYVMKLALPMKLVDVYFSFDDNRITFAFIADGRVDFRQLVKELTRYFQKSIRLYQIGIRDEARMNADVGTCGIQVCCRKHLKTLGNVSSDMAELQQISHRGPERLSGICGRLKCCLIYEQELYEELAKKLPPVGTKVKTAKGRGEVIGWHVLKKSVDVLLEDETIVEIPIKL